MEKLKKKDKRHLKLTDRKFMTPNELLTVMDREKFAIVEIYIYGVEAHKIEDVRGRVPDIDGDLMWVTKKSFQKFNQFEMASMIEMDIVRVVREIEQNRHIHSERVVTLDDSPLQYLNMKNLRIVIRCGNEDEEFKVLNDIALQVSCNPNKVSKDILITSSTHMRKNAKFMKISSEMKCLTHEYGVYLFTTNNVEEVLSFITLDFKNLNHFRKDIAYPELKVIVLGRNTVEMLESFVRITDSLMGNEYYLINDIEVDTSEVYCPNSIFNQNSYNTYLHFKTEDALRSYNNSIPLRLRKFDDFEGDVLNIVSLDKNEKGESNEC